MCSIGHSAQSAASMVHFLFYRSPFSFGGVRTTDDEEQGEGEGTRTLVLWYSRYYLHLPPLLYTLFICEYDVLIGCLNCSLLFFPIQACNGGYMPRQGTESARCYGTERGCGLFVLPKKKVRL